MCDYNENSPGYRYDLFFFSEYIVYLNKYVYLKHGIAHVNYFSPEASGDK